MIKSIFKYVDVAGTTGILENGNLFFSSPTHLNDPFDISIQTLFGYDPFDFSTHFDEFLKLIGSTDEIPPGNGSPSFEKVALLRQIIKSKPAGYLESIKKEIDVGQIWNEMEIRDHAAEVLFNIKTSFAMSGVFCASKRFDNYLMWAHYSEKHKGAVLEFSPNLNNDSFLTLAEEVTYSNIRPYLYDSHKDFLYKSLFRNTSDFLSEYTKKITKTKSVEWGYEEEMRVYQPLLVNVLQGEKSKPLPYHNEELKTVYLGCKMSKDVKEQTIKLALKRNPSVKLYEMVPDPFHYKLHAKAL